MCEQVSGGSSEERKTGEALQAYYNDFIGVKSQKADYKMGLFLIIKGSTAGSTDLLKKYGQMFKTLGVKIYIMAFGSGNDMAQLQMITDMSMIYQAKDFSAVMTGAGLMVGGAAKSQSMFLLLQSQMGACKSRHQGSYTRVKRVSN